MCKNLESGPCVGVPEKNLNVAFTGEGTLANSNPNPDPKPSTQPWPEHLTNLIPLKHITLTQP